MTLILYFHLLELEYGYSFFQYIRSEWYIIVIPSIIGAFIGLIFGLCSTWGIEMKIQEAYWRLDVMKELKKQTETANKITPIAKTVVAIENRSGSAEIKEETN